MKRLARKLSVMMMIFCLAFCSVSVSATTVAVKTTAKSPTTEKKKPTTKTDNFIKITRVRHFSKSTSKRQTIRFKLNNKAKSGNKITYKKLGGCKYLTITKNGKVTVPKLIRNHKKEHHKNHYLRIKMTTSGGNGYKSITKTYTLRVAVR